MDRIRISKSGLTKIQGAIIAAIIIIPIIAGVGYYLSMSNQPSATQGTVAGKVMDATTDAPIEGATVTSEGQTCLTPADGTYAFNLTVGKTYTLTVSKAGYKTKSSSVNVEQVNAYRLDFALSPSLPVLSLTLVALNGTEVVLDNSMIVALPHVEYRGGLMTSAGSIRAVANYTGVQITTLCNLIGGLADNTSLRVTAADGYSMVFTSDQALGNSYVTFDPATGDEVQYNQSLFMILVYFKDGQPLPSDEGPLRLAILGSEGLITEGHNWVKFVVKIEVRPAVQDWILTLEGFLTESIDRSTFESGANCHSANWTDSESQMWTGIPLWLLVGRVDDANQHDDLAFNRTLADEGYRVRVIASDGYKIDLNSTRVKLNGDIIVANEMNNMPLPETYWPLKLVGANLTKSEMMRNIVEIKLVFGEDWTLTLNGTVIETVSRDVFESGANCHSANWTDSESQMWTGIPLWLLVGRVDDSLEHGSDAFNRTLADIGYIVQLTAVDGRKTELNSTFVKLNGGIIVANEMNNMPLPETYRPLRLVGAALTKSQMIRNIVEIRIIFNGS